MIEQVANYCTLVLFVACWLFIGWRLVRAVYVQLFTRDKE